MIIILLNVKCITNFSICCISILLSKIYLSKMENARLNLKFHFIDFLCFVILFDNVKWFGNMHQFMKFYLSINKIKYEVLTQSLSLMF